MDIEFYKDFESFHNWAMKKVLGLCRQLTPHELTEGYSIGQGSALAILQHMAGAERIWLDRWHSKPSSADWQAPDSIDELEAFFQSLATERSQWLDSDSNLFSTDINYANLRGEKYTQNLGELVLHVLNHGVQHRAQLLYILKQYGKTVAGGLDYIFYRIAAPTVELSPESAANCRQWWLEVGESISDYAAPELDSLLRYAKYGDWATKLICVQASHLTDEQLDRDWGMGVGSIRKTLLHLYDAECFWQANWERSGAPFNRSSESLMAAEISEMWLSMAEKRNRKTLQMSGDQFGSTVMVDFGSGPLQFRFSESLIQLAVHGTLHRAQLNNMLRSSGSQPQAIDYVVWLRQLA